MVIVPHPPCSPDLALFGFVLFHKLKMKLKGRRSETVSDLKQCRTSKGNRMRYSTALRKITSTVLLEMTAKIKLLLLLLFIVHSINPYPAEGLQMQNKSM
jgi:hypothetical protein